MNIKTCFLRQMLQAMRLYIFEMILHEFRRQRFAFAVGFKLNDQTFFNITRTATDRFEPHNDLPRFFNCLNRTIAHRGNFFVGSRQTSVFIEISDNTNRRFFNFFAHLLKIKLPFEMFG